MDTAAFTQRFMRDMRDMRDAQRDSGAYLGIAPVARQDHFVEPAPRRAEGDVGVALPRTVWQGYGDTGIIDQHWTSMERFLASIAASNPDLVRSKAPGVDHGDWPALGAVDPGDPTTPKNLIGTAFWKGAADQVADMARVRGRAAEATHYAALAGRDVPAHRRQGERHDRQRVADRLYSRAPRRSARVGRAGRGGAGLAADIRRRGTLLWTGFLGTPCSLVVLADAGEIALVYDLLLRTAYP